MEEKDYNKIGLAVIIVVGLVIGAMFLSGFLWNIIGFAISLAIWSVTGYFAGKLIRGEGYGIIGNIVIGMVGGIFGSLLMTIFNWFLPFNIPFFGGIIAGVLGAVAFIVVVRLFFNDQFAA